MWYNQIILELVGVLTMPRRIMLNTGVQTEQILEEVLADDEKQLQELVKNRPDLLPVEDLRMTGPLAVIGRETGLPSGAVDLVALSREGNLLVVEFKTGPQNPDFRDALAQLVDYGSDLWGRDFNSFERDVPLRYFKGRHCHDPELASCNTLAEALRHTWSDLDEEEYVRVEENLSSQLRTGCFHYALLAQKFTEPSLKTIEYLNEVSKLRFYAVEVVRFCAENLEAFEARFILGPPLKASTSNIRVTISEMEFLSGFADEFYRDTVERLLQSVKEMGYTVNPGSKGVSVRRRIPGSEVEVTVAWIAPPSERVGPGGRDVTLGTLTQPKGVPPHIVSQLERAFLTNADEFGDFAPISGNAKGIRLTPENFVEKQQETVQCLHNLGADIDGFAIFFEGGG